MALKVTVSPFFGGDNWTDEQTGITFEKSNTGTMATYDLSNVTADKLDGIRRAIRLNALTLVEGSVDEAPQPEAKEPVKEEVKEEVKVEIPAEEVVIEEPKKPASKKK